MNATSRPGRRTRAYRRGRSAAAAVLLGLLLAAPVARAGEETVCPTGTNLLDTLPAPEIERIEAAARATPNGEGRLFRIERDGVETSHLFGTMHLSDPRVLALPAPVEAAFEAADRLVVETLDIADEATLTGQILMRPDLTQIPAGRDLADLVPADRRTEFAAALAEQGMPLPTVRTLQPWFVAVALAMPACETERLAEGARVLDLQLIDEAQAAGKTLSGLESGTEQLEALASLPLELQAENLMATLDLVDRLPDVFETMTVLYLEDRIALIGEAVEALAPSGTDEASAAAVWAAFEERVVTMRNRTMAERLGPILEEGSAFVAIGALHLPGEEGLVELLSQDGWTLTRAD